MAEANGNVSPSDIATLGLVGGYGGYGIGGRYGYGGHGAEYLSSEAHANGTAVAAKVDAAVAATAVQTQFFDAAERSRQFQELNKSQTEERLASQATVTQLTQAMSDNAKEAAKCCCDAQLEAARNAADIKAEILASETRGVTRELDRSERRVEASESTSAIVAALRDQTVVLSGLIQQRSHP